MSAIIAESIAALVTLAAACAVAFTVGIEHGKATGITTGKQEQRNADNDERDGLIAQATAKLKLDAAADLKTAKEQNAALEASRSATQTMADTWFARAQLLDQRLSAPSAVVACSIGVSPAGTAPGGTGNTTGPGNAGLSDADVKHDLSACIAALIPAQAQLKDLLDADPVWRARDARGCEP